MDNTMDYLHDTEEAQGPAPPFGLSRPPSVPPQEQILREGSKGASRDSYGRSMTCWDSIESETLTREMYCHEYLDTGKKSAGVFGASHDSSGLPGEPIHPSTEGLAYMEPYSSHDLGRHSQDHLGRHMMSRVEAFSSQPSYASLRGNDCSQASYLGLGGSTQASFLGLNRNSNAGFFMSHSGGGHSGGGQQQLLGASMLERDRLACSGERMNSSDPSREVQRALGDHDGLQLLGGSHAMATSLEHLAGAGGLFCPMDVSYSSSGKASSSGNGTRFSAGGGTASRERARDGDDSPQGSAMSYSSARFTNANSSRAAMDVSHRGAPEVVLRGGESLSRESKPSPARGRTPARDAPAGPADPLERARTLTTRIEHHPNPAWSAQPEDEEETDTSSMSSDEMEEDKPGVSQRTGALPPQMITAQYVTPDHNSLLAPEGGGVVMSQNRLEWLSKLNRSTPGIQGKVRAIGSVPSEKQGSSVRRILVLAPDTKSIPPVAPLFRVFAADLFDRSSSWNDEDEGPREHSGVAPLPSKDHCGSKKCVPLTRPSFSPFETGLVAVGTDTHKDNPASSNSVLLAQVHRGSHASSAARIVRQAVAHLDAPVACIDWLSGTELIVANGSNLTVLQMHDGEMRERAKISELHSDSIRDMKLSTFKRESCLSVGFDGQCYITDLDKVVSARLSSRTHSEASLYRAGNSLSTAAWNPNLANQVSIATDCGHLHVFDTRLSNPDRRGMVIKTGKQGLYANAWVDAYSALLGYGDGFLRLFDLRHPRKCVVQFQDPVVDRIGDIVLDPQRRFFVTFGSPNFGVWRSDPHSGFTLWHHDHHGVSAQQKRNKSYSNSGAFKLTGGRQHGIFITSTTDGLLSLYDVHTAEQAAIAVSAR